jgi:cobalt-zinc-cadmium efflux system outer membrane protein
MTRRRFRTAAVVALVVAAPAARAADLPPLTLQELEEKALARNPTLAAAAAAVQAAVGYRDQAGRNPNPVVGYEGEELTLNKDKWVRQTHHYFFVEQRIVIGRKLKRGEELFEAARVEAGARADVQQQRVRNAVRVLYYDALVAEREVQARAELARIAREAVKTSEDLLNVGQADQPDLLEAQIEADRAEIEEQSARYAQDAGWRILAAVVGEPDMPLRPLAGDPEQGIPMLEQDALLAALLRESPEIKAAEATVRRGEAAVQRSRSERLGDLFLRGGPSYNYDTSHGLGGWAARLEVAFPLPLFNRAQGSTAAARAEANMAQAEVRRVELSLRARLASEFQEYARARGLVQRYRESVIPKAQRAHELYLARFREMGAAYPQVLIAQRTLAQVRAEYLEALDDVWHHAILLQGFLLEGGLADPIAPSGHEADVMEAGTRPAGAEGD